jgi:periplasmic protein TonB
MIARLGRVTLSVILHAGLIALLLAWPAVDWARPLFVDLVDQGEHSGLRTEGPSAAPPARPAARIAGAVPAPPRAAERAAPVAPTAPAPVPPPEPVAPPAAAPPSSVPAMVVEPPPASPAAPVTPPVSSAPSGPVAGRGVPAESGAPSGTGAGAQTRDDLDRGATGGAPGSPLALATPGSGGAGAPAEYGPYLRLFRQRVLESLIYPLAARRQGLGGTVELHVWLEATGRVRDVQVARSSSHALLDDAALETIRRLGPVPFPESLPRRPLLIRIPLVYELR